MGSRITEGSGVRYELQTRGSFTDRRPPWILNHILSYRDAYTKFGLPRDVQKRIDDDIKTAREFAKQSKKKNKVPDSKLMDAYFRVIREYYTKKGADSGGERPMMRYSDFLSERDAKKVVKDLETIKKELRDAENVPEYSD